MKTLGIILAGGKSSRLYPATLITTKQILPVYDKPLIYYPLSLLMLAGIRDIVTIVTPREVDTFRALYYNSKFSGAIRTPIIEQFNPNGIPEAFNLVSEYCQDHEEWLESFDKVVLILGDNLFHGATISGALREAIEKYPVQATIFGQKVPDLTRFGVATVDSNLLVKTIVEKPSKIEDAKNSYAITGLYVFPKNVFQYAKNLKPSSRGETEIVDLLKCYHSDKPVANLLNMEILKRGVSWFDTGTPNSLLDAAHYVKTIQTNQGFLVGSPHEVAYNNGWMSEENLREYIKLSEKSDYSQKLLQLIEENNGSSET